MLTFDMLLNRKGSLAKQAMAELKKKQLEHEKQKAFEKTMIELLRNKSNS